MRHVFIVNPAAGKTQKAVDLIPRIEAYFAEHGGEYEILTTEKPGDATELAREVCAKGTPVRLYACGGDGTLVETAAGVRDCAWAQLTAVPCGSANDYIRSFGTEADFMDLPRLIQGEAREVDGIRCGDYLSLNICAIGMDATVAWKMVKYKHWPLVSGPMAYNLAVVDTFFHRLGVKQRVVMDTPEGQIVKEGQFLFSLAASGQYYGGGYHAAPTSVPDDGLLDFVLVDKIGRLDILKFLGTYRAGKHLGLPIVHHCRGTRMEVVCETPAAVTADGECFEADRITFELVRGAFRFVVPAATAKVPATV